MAAIDRSVDTIKYRQFVNADSFFFNSLFFNINKIDIFERLSYKF